MNFACLLRGGKPIECGDKHSEESMNLSCSVGWIMEDLSKEELDQKENLFLVRCKIIFKMCVP